jgi:hypothetical protein
MKADLQKAAPPLRIPFWVPESVAQVARQTYAEASKHVDGFSVEEIASVSKFLIPLVRDQRMRGVWHELSRRRNGIFLHPASIVQGPLSDNRQAAAMAELFEAAVTYRLKPGVTTTRRRAEQRRNEFLAKAQALRIDTAMGGLLDVIAFGGERDIWTDKRRRRLAAAADAYQEIAAATFAADMKAALERDSGDASARWYARSVARQCDRLFGSPLYGLTAIITSVAWDRKIAPQSVRQWCKLPCS